MGELAKTHRSWRVASAMRFPDTAIPSGLSNSRIKSVTCRPSQPIMATLPAWYVDTTTDPPH